MELIINIDGGSRGNPGPGASAYVIKDTTGKLIAQEGKFFASCTNNHAEFMALYIALKKAAQLKADKLKVYSDSQLLVMQYIGKYKIKNPNLQELMGQIKAVAVNFKKVDINHVPREQNKAADAICNITMDAVLKGKKAPVYTALVDVPAAVSIVPKATIAKQASTPKTVAGKAVIKKTMVKKAKPAPVQLELFD